MPTRFAEEAGLKHTLIYWKYFIMHYLIQREKKKKDAATTVTILTMERMKPERKLLSKTW